MRTVVFRVECLVVDAPLYEAGGCLFTLLPVVKGGDACSHSFPLHGDIASRDKRGALRGDRFARCASRESLRFATWDKRGAPSALSAARAKDELDSAPLRFPRGSGQAGMTWGAKRFAPNHFCLLRFAFCLNFLLRFATWDKRGALRSESLFPSIRPHTTAHPFQKILIFTGLKSKTEPIEFSEPLHLAD